MINKNFKLIKESFPFPYVKIQDFLENNFFKQLESNFPKPNKFISTDRSVKRMDFDTSFGNNLYNNLINQNEFYNEFHNYIYSRRFINFFLDIFKNEIEEELKKGELLENINNLPIKPSPYEVGEVFGKNQLNKLKPQSKILI